MRGMRLGLQSSACWLSAGLLASYNHGTPQASNVLHMPSVHIIPFGHALPCCILVKPKYFCLLSTQFILNKKDCCQHVEDICNVDLSNLDPGKAFWDCRPGQMPSSVISVSLLPRDSCLSYWVYLWEGKKWSINTKCNKGKCQANSYRLSSYHFLLWRNSICPLKLEQNIEKMFPNELANKDAKGVRAELWRGY